MLRILYDHIEKNILRGEVKVLLLLIALKITTVKFVFPDLLHLVKRKVLILGSVYTGKLYSKKINQIKKISHFYQRKNMNCINKYIFIFKLFLYFQVIL